jgi:hypothetical protein
MLFRLSNAPTTLQALMNEVLRPFLCRFVLVFFDDIPIYSSSWAKHLQHLRLILDALKQHHMFMKCSKCVFVCSEVVYLGHVISATGVAMDQQKVQAILDSPTSSSIHVMHSFLGLTDYYCRFICDFDKITVPLTKLLCKGGFRWCPEAGHAFCTLQHSLTTALVLQLLNFDKLFMVECDASGSGLGAVLHHGLRA